MKISCFALVAVLHFLEVQAGAGAAQGDRTITKVVKLLQDMMEKSKIEGEKEEKLYLKFKCFSETSIADKKDEIAALSKRDNLLGSSIASIKGVSGELAVKHGGLKAAITDNKAAQKDAAEMRKKAEKTYKDTKADLKASIAQMDGAIKALTGAGADQTGGVRGGKKAGLSMAAFGADVKSALTAASIFLTHAQREQMASFLQAPQYSSQSDGILGILKNMRDTFKANLASLETTEAQDENTNTEFMKTKKDALKKMTGALKETDEGLSLNDDSLSSKKKQDQTTTADLADAQKALTGFEDAYEKRTKQYNEKKALRANEEAAISQAIAILDSDEAFETFGSVSATSSGGKAAAASFLQLSQRQSLGSLRRDVERALIAGKSARVASLLNVMEANPFAEVFIEVSRMKKVVEDEGKQDEKYFNWCKAERTRNNGNLKDVKAEITNYNSDIDQVMTTLNDPLKGLKAQLKGTEASLTKNSASQRTETKQRFSENIAYQADVKNLVSASELLEKAIAVLKNFYENADKASSLLQEGHAYKGQSKMGNSALTMLKFILSESKKELISAHQDEEKAQHDFEDSMAELKSDETKLQKSLVKLQQDLTATETKLLEKKEDLKDAEAQQVKIEDYLKQIKTPCDFITKNFDLRNKNRKTELASLEKAVTMIKASAAYRNAVGKPVKPKPKPVFS